MLRMLQRVSPIGLDIGPRSIAAVQVQRGRGSWKIAAAATVDRPEGVNAVPTAEELARLNEILGRQGFTGRDVVIAAPDSRVLSGTIELPPAGSGAPLALLAKAELARMHRKDGEAMEIAAWRIPSPTRSGSFTYMMAAGCMRTEIDELLDAIDGAGFVAMGVDIRAWAMARACEPLLRGTNNVSALLDLSEAEAVLSVVHSHTVVYERVMSDSGVGNLRLRLKNELKLEPDVADYVLETVGLSGRNGGGDDGQGPHSDAAEMIRDYFAGLIQEFRTALAYAVHRYPTEVDRVLVHGAGASIPGLVQTIAEELGVEITVVTPASLAEAPEWLRDVCGSPALTTALGLSEYSEAA